MQVRSKFSFRWIWLSGLVCGMLVSGFAFAQEDEEAPPPVAKKKVIKKTTWDCSAKALRLKDCRLTMNESRIQVWKNKIFLTGPRARAVLDLPYSAEQAKGELEWQFMKLRDINSRWFIESAIWSPADASSAVESLTWTVYELTDHSITKVLEKTIQKRKKMDNRYKKDKPFPYELKAVKKSIHWNVGIENGHF